MRRTLSVVLLSAGLGVVLSRPAAAVVQDDLTNRTGTSQSATYTTNPPPGITTYNNIAQAYNGSATYIGGGWVLTASHVDATQFIFPGDPTVYTPVPNSAIVFTNADSSYSDLEAIKLNATPNLSPISIATSSPNSAETIYNVGYGDPRNTAFSTFGSYQGYGVAASSVSSTTESWGTNNVLNLGTALNPQYTEYNSDVHSTIFVAQFGNGTDQIVDHDSGGAVFNSAGQLIGINDAMATFDDQQADTAVFGDQSYMIDVATYASQIDALPGVPEPAMLGIVALAGIGLLTARRRGNPGAR